MFTFKPTLHKLRDDYLYFFIPAEISKTLKEGDYIDVRFKGIPKFKKLLSIPRKYIYRNKYKKLFMVIIPQIITENYHLKHGEEYKVKIEI